MSNEDLANERKSMKEQAYIIIGVSTNKQIIITLKRQLRTKDKKYWIINFILIEGNNERIKKIQFSMGTKTLQKKIVHN